MFCGYCGNELRPDAKFCPKCGGKVLPIQEQPAQVKASEDAVAVSSPVPEKSEKNESQSKAAPIQQEVSPSSGLVADITDSIREALRGESYYCGKCGTKLKPGAKFCPECGAFTGMLSKDASGATKVSGGVGDLFASKTGQRKEQSSQQAGVGPIQKSYETFDGGTDTVVQTKNKLTRKAKIGIGLLAVLLLILMVTVFGGSEYDSGLVEANNAYGLSTTVTLDEFIDLYNQRIIEVNNIERGPDYDFFLFVNGGIKRDRLKEITSEQLKQRGVKGYLYKDSLSAYATYGIENEILIGVDSETNYVRAIVILFDVDDFHSNSVSDETRGRIREKFNNLLYAMAGVNESRYNRWNQKIESKDSIVWWSDGLAFSLSEDSGGTIAKLQFQAITKSAYEQWSTGRMLE